MERLTPRPRIALHRDEALVVAFIALAAAAVLIAESLSLLGLLARWPIAISWSLLAPAATLALRRVFTLTKDPAPWTPLDRALAALLALILLAALLAGLQAGTNNADTLNYHLPRQLIWLQQGSLDHAPAWSAWQLMYPPLAELLGVQLMALTNGDRLAALPQWLACIASLAAVSAISRQLGLQRQHRLLAALLCLASPQVYMWATNAKNDLVLAALLAALTWLTLILWQRRTLTLALALSSGLIAGLALFTKSTAAILILPIAIVQLIAGLRALGGRCIPLFAAAIALAVLINTPHWARNHATFHSILGPTSQDLGAYDVLADTITPGSLIVGSALRLATHLALPVAPWSDALRSSITWLGDTLGAPITDPTFMHRPETWRYMLRFWLKDEDLYISTALALGSLIAIPIALARVRRQPQLALVALILSSAFILLSTLTKWTVWDQRYHIALAPLAAVLVAATLRRRAIIWPVAVLSIGIVIHIAIVNQRRPLGTRHSIFTTAHAEARYRQREDWREPLARAVDTIAAHPHRTIGLRWPKNARVYLPLIELRRRLGASPRLIAFAAQFPVGTTDHYPADIVLAIDSPDREITDGAGRTLAENWREGRFSIYMPTSISPTPPPNEP